MKRLFAAETLEELDALVRASNAETLRAALLKELLALVEYRNAAEWNRLVRVCEALAIVGWGEQEPLEAKAAKWINGSFYSSLQNRTFEDRFLSARWQKSGATFVLDPDNRHYHPSPDRPGHLEVPSSEYREAHPETDRADHGVTVLASQRNSLPKNPLRIVLSGQLGDEIYAGFLDELRTLRLRLDRELRPAGCGPGLDWIGISYVTSGDVCEFFHAESDVSPKNKVPTKVRAFVRPRLDCGPLSTRGEKKVRVSIHLPRAFAALPRARQKQDVASDLRTILTTVGAKVAKKRVPFDFGALTADLEGVLATW